MTMEALLAFDVGGSRLKAGVVSLEDGRVSGDRVADVHAATAPTVLELMTRIGHELLARFDCSGAGVCVPGLVDSHGTVVSLPGKLDGIVGVDLGEFVRSQLGLEAVIANDAAAYALGEAHFGAGAGFDRVVAMTIGTGVGVGVVDHGVFVTRTPQGGGILGGHIPISERVTGPVDSNGQPDTIEALCCAGRIVVDANECGLPADSIEDVFRAASRGQPAALRVLGGFHHHLTRAVVALAHAHAPDVVVIGGGVMKASAAIDEERLAAQTRGLEDAVNSRLFGSYRVHVRIAELGDSAALSGLAAMHRNRAEK
jgi:glucokinase